jgi:hypothetical protein
MLVDSIIKDVNLKKLHRSGVRLHKLYNKSLDHVTLNCVLEELHKYDIYIASGNSRWTINQRSFFKLARLIGLWQMEETRYYSSYIYFGHRLNVILPEDITSFSKILAESGKATLGLVDTLKLFGVTDKNCYIDNYDYSISFNDEGLRNLFRVIATALSQFQYATMGYVL